MDIINRNKSIMESYSEIIGEALGNLNAILKNLVAFAKQEYDKVQVELASTANDLLNQVVK